MIKTVEVIVIIALLIFSFFLGVKYSDGIKSRMSWLQTQDEQEVELPDLSNENGEAQITGEEPIDPNAPPAIENLDNVDPTQVPAQPAVQGQVAPVAPAPSADPVQAPVPAPVAPAPVR
ncbi:MAG: hypothetical protein ACO201_07040 [Rickettsiales bacterium]